MSVYLRRTAVNMADRRDGDVGDVVPGVPGNAAELPTESDPPRENMIVTAVRFLQNPKVRESPFAQRRAFLAKKGLTNHEIDLAITRSGTADDERRQPVGTAVGAGGSTSTHQLVAVNQTITPVPMWTRWRDYTATAIILGGLSYGLYTLIQKYVKPVWFGPSEEQRRREALQQSIVDLQANMQAVITNIHDMQQLLNKQQENISQVILNTSAQRGPIEMDRLQQQQYVTEIKGEIKSLKGLLLNRKQFPSTPKSSPVIPAWQLESASKTSPESSQSLGLEETSRVELVSSSSTATAGVAAANGDQAESASKTSPESSQSLGLEETSRAELVSSSSTVAAGVAAANGDQAELASKTSPEISQSLGLEETSRVELVSSSSTAAAGVAAANGDQSQQVAEISDSHVGASHKVAPRVSEEQTEQEEVEGSEVRTEVTPEVNQDPDVRTSGVEVVQEEAIS